jgi:hypothetical protein
MEHRCPLFSQERTFILAKIGSAFAKRRHPLDERGRGAVAHWMRSNGLQALLPRNASHDLLKRELRRVENVGYLLQTDRGRCGIDAQKLVCE